MLSFVEFLPVDDKIGLLKKITEKQQQQQQQQQNKNSCMYWAIYIPTELCNFIV